MQHVNELAPHYYALFLAAYKGYPSDIALDLIETGRATMARGSEREDTLEMAKMLDEGWKYREVGEMFGLSVSGVNSRVQRFKKGGRNNV